MRDFRPRDSFLRPSLTTTYLQYSTVRRLSRGRARGLLGWPTLSLDYSTRRTVVRGRAPAGLCHALSRVGARRASPERPPRPSPAVHGYSTVSRDRIHTVGVYRNTANGNAGSAPAAAPGTAVHPCAPTPASVPGPRESRRAHSQTIQGAALSIYRGGCAAKCG